MSTAAQDEFNKLVASKERVSRHPEDVADEYDDDGSDTLVDDTPGNSKSKSSLRSSQYDGGNSSDADSDTEVRRHHRGQTTYTLPNNYVYNANTGPKGVIADAQAFEMEKSVGNKRTYLRTEDFVLPKNQRPVERKIDDLAFDANQDEADDAEDDLEDDEAMAKWRETRLSELKKGMLRRQGGGGQSRGRFGSLRFVDAMGFLETVESVPSGTVVVVYVFDDELPISDAYQSHIKVLAAKYPHIKFIALHYEEAEIDGAGVPAVLAYRNGDQFAALIPLRDQVSFANDVITNMEEAFRSHGIL